MSATRAIAYCRFSPRRNGESCESNTVQLAYIEKHCAENNLDLLGRFSDENKSGDDEDRLGLWAAIQAVPHGGVLVVYKLDRLARSVYLDEYLRRQLAKKKATVEAVVGNRAGDSPEDVLVRQILAAAAEYERRIIAARTKAAALFYQANGRAMSKIPPYGTREGEPIEVVKNGQTVSQRTLVDDPAEQAVIERIVLERERGASLRAIAAGLQRDGVPSRGRSWHHGLVKAICRRHQPM